MLGVPIKSELWLAKPKRDWSEGLMIFVFGHSAWRGADGFVDLPKDSQVGFYNDAGESMNAQRAKSMIWNIEDLKAPDNIIREYRSVQNLTLVPAPEHLSQVRAAFESADRNDKAIPLVTTDAQDGVNLSTIVTAFPNKYIIWLGCRGMQVL